MEKMTPERAMEILRKQGMEVSSEQARQILDFLYKLAGLAVAQYVTNKKDSVAVHSIKLNPTGETKHDSDPTEN